MLVPMVSAIEGVHCTKEWNKVFCFGMVCVVLITDHIFMQSVVPHHPFLLFWQDGEGLDSF